MQEDTDDFSWLIGADTLDKESLEAIASLKKDDKLKSRIQ
jgi:hypothetical protein